MSQAISTTIEDLPQVLDIKILDGVNDGSMEDLRSTLISQIEYNSRLHEGGQGDTIEVEVLNIDQAQGVVKVKIKSHPREVAA